jgi:acetolactate synthase-1/2/3 large subunit
LTTAGFLKELREFLDRDSIVLSDAGHAQDHLWRAFPIYEPRTHISSGGFSTMGFTVPAALGCKLAAPNRQVVGFIGDGSFLMTCQELATAVQYNLPVVYCVSNNNAWGSIRDMQRHWYGEEGIYGTEFQREGTTEPANTDFVQLGKAFGVYSERIVKRAEVKPALQRALASKGPALLEVMTDPAYPYAELPTTGWADYPTPEYLHKDIRKSKRKGAP